jgi:hypothetical protein
MPVTKRDPENSPADESRAAPGTLKCFTCFRGRLERMMHHMRMTDNGLEAHLVEVYGTAYKMDGRLDQRLKFVKTFRVIYRDECKNGGALYSIPEAYNLAAARAGVIKKNPTPTQGGHSGGSGSGSMGIDGSVPNGDR